MIANTTVRTVCERRSFWKPVFFITDRPPSSGGHVGNADDRNQDKEHNCLGLSGAFGVGGVGVDDVQSQHFRGLDDVAVSQRLKGRAAREGQVLVIELEAVGQGQERADGDRRHDVRDCDVPERFPAGRTVDLCGLQHILRDCLQACDINDHHIAYLLPAHEDDQSPEAVFGFQHDGCVEVAEDAVEDHEPDIAQNDATG